MTGGSIIFWGILIFIGLVFDQCNSEKKEGVKSNRLQIKE
ncbi:flagellar motor protein [Bacillus toyonensis]